MNPSEDPYRRSPIAAPDGNFQPLETYNSGVVRGDWSTAPKVVRNWARSLALLGAVLIPFAIFFVILMGRPTGGIEARGAVMLGCLASVWLTEVWLMGALKRGESDAWSIQVFISALSLLSCGLPTILHGYLLSRWFKPEVKEWFGRD